MSAPNLGPSPSQVTLMGHNILAEIAARQTRRRRRVRLALVGGTLSLALGLTAASIGVAIAPTELQDSVFTCYLSDDARGDFSAVQVVDLEAMDAGERVGAALSACTDAFGAAGVPAPQPTACELRDHRLAVFPNRERVDAATLCTALGLGLPPE